MRIAIPELAEKEAPFRALLEVYLGHTTQDPSCSCIPRHYDCAMDAGPGGGIAISPYCAIAIQDGAYSRSSKQLGVSALTNGTNGSEYTRGGGDERPLLSRVDYTGARGTRQARHASCSISGCWRVQPSPDRVLDAEGGK